MNGNCNLLLPGVPLQSYYWTSLFILLGTVSRIIYCSVSTNFTVQTCVAIHALVNISAMLISTLLVLIMHYIHGLTYPLIRASRERRAACALHSSLSISTFIVPSSSLLFMTIIHYRAIFWAKFDYKLQVKHLVYPILVIWFVTSAFAVVWTSFHGHYSSWYCLPFTSSFSWVDTTLQTIISIVCVTSIAWCVVGY